MVANRDRILYIDDNHTNLMLFRELFSELYEVFITSSVDKALKELGTGEYKAVFVDYLMPELTGLDFINKAQLVSPESPYIIVTAHANLDVAISAINQGDVYRFIEKPWKEAGLLSTIKSATELYELRRRKNRLMEEITERNKELSNLNEQLEQENQYLQEEISNSSGFEEIVSRNPAFHKVLKQVKQVSDTKATVLVLGETGTGKELVARAIHKLSSRKTNPFIKINCAALPEPLIESELFGYVKGAFTGAADNKKGKFELAHRGTLFLDEIGELPLLLQPKLLRVLQEGEIEKLGSREPVLTDVRIIAATNSDLNSDIKNGKFRSDLYYRLNVFPITLPPLRDRTEDISLLADYFLKKFNTIYKKSIKKVSKVNLRHLNAYSWPGNIRELENIIERAVIISSGDTLQFPDGFLDGGVEQEYPEEFRSLEEVEKNYIEQVLQSTNFRVSGEKGAAKILGMNSTTLESRIKKLGIRKS